MAANTFVNIWRNKMAANTFKEDSWEWHAFEASKWIADHHHVSSEDWAAMWADVFVNEPEVDWHSAQLGWSGLVLADRHAVPHAWSNEKAVKFLAGKQRDYGPLNITKFGIDGIKVRSSDKVERILNLKGKDRDGTTEPLGDAYFDLWGYMVVLRMFKLGVFTKPLADEMPVDPPVSEETFPVEVCYGDLVGIKMVFDGASVRTTIDGTYVYEIVKLNA